MRTQATITIPADERWVHTGFQLVAGTRYRIEVPPGQQWEDWGIKFGPKGGTRGIIQYLAAGLLRFKGKEGVKAEYFTLIGTIGRSMKHAFLIGEGSREFTPSVSGELVCFANDVWLAYWNNSGTVTFSITPLG